MPLDSALLLLGAVAVPLTLLWDLAWESTIGVDRFFGPPHAANYLAVVLAGAAALHMAVSATRRGVGGVPLGRVRAPLGAWIALWGAFAFLAALLFDRWWQSSYGLAAGIWHPPQIAKTLAYFALALGAWLALLGEQRDTRGALAAALAAGVVLAMISVVTSAQSFANRQHSALFFQLGCAAYPLPLAAQSLAGRLRAPATTAALAYMALVAAMVWLLPLFPCDRRRPGPSTTRWTTCSHRPFRSCSPFPRSRFDALFRWFAGREQRGGRSAAALEAGLAFAVLFIGAQWLFSGFLLSPASDLWLFAGGGRHWPFFLRIDPSARTAYWDFLSPSLDVASAGVAALLAIVSTRAGLALGAALRGTGR